METADGDPSDSRLGFQRKLSRAHIQTSPRPHETGLANVQDIIKMLKSHNTRSQDPIKSRRNLTSSQGRVDFERKRQSSKEYAETRQEQRLSMSPPGHQIQGKIASLMQKNSAITLTRRGVHPNQEGPREEHKSFEREPLRATLPGHFVLVPQPAQT